MTMRSIFLLCLLTLSLSVTATPPGPVHASSSAAPASTPRQAVSILLASVTRRVHGSCHPFSGTASPASTVATCPITPRMRHALLHPAGPGNLLCRCQNPPRRIVILGTMTLNRVYVEGYFDYGPNSFVITYVVVHRPRGWLVDDMFCLRHPETSVYTKRDGAECP